MSDPVKPYDLESVYDAEIAPLMTQILAICKRAHMPMIASFKYRDAEDGPSFCTSHLQWPDRPDAGFHKAVRVIRANTSVPLIAMTIIGRKP